MEFYQLRYNESTSQLEYHQGGFWFVPTLENPDPVAGITELTGDVTAGPGSGSVATTVALVGGVAASTLAGAIPSAGLLNLTLSSADPTVTFSANANTSVIYQEHSGNHNLILQNGAGGGFTISRAAGTITLNTLNLLGGNNAIRTNADLCAGTQAADASAIMQADSTTKGFLPPRMTTTQRDAISSPATGLQIYNTDDSAIQYYSGSGWAFAGSIVKEEIDIQEITAGDGSYLAFLAASGSPIVQLSSDGGSPNQDFFIATKGVGQNIYLDTHASSGAVNIVGVGASAVSEATSVFSVNSTAQGMLPPRMTTTEKNAIGTPAEGLMVYDISLHALCFYNGSTWKQVATV